ncbi:MAG: hypothetical protein HZB38_07525 [Planctomycetes bacterium]|nr:hypothetical protein [Planctomycetota bacterium]
MANSESNELRDEGDLLAALDASSSVPAPENGATAERPSDPPAEPYPTTTMQDGSLISESDLAIALKEIEAVVNEGEPVASASDPPADAAAADSANESPEPSDAAPAENAGGEGANSGASAAPAGKPLKFTVGRKGGMPGALPSGAAQPPAASPNPPAPPSGVTAPEIPVPPPAAVPPPDVSQAAEIVVAPAIGPVLRLCKAVVRAVEFGLDYVHRPIAARVPAALPLLGTLSLTTIAVSVAAMIGLPILLPARDAITYLDERVTALSEPPPPDAVETEPAKGEGHGEGAAKQAESKPPEKKAAAHGEKPKKSKNAAKSADGHGSAALEGGQH